MTGGSSSTRMGSCDSSRTNRAACASLILRFRSATSKTLATSRGHSAGTAARSSSSRSRTASVAGVASSSKHHAIVSDASTTMASRGSEAGGTAGTIRAG